MYEHHEWNFSELKDICETLATNDPFVVAESINLIIKYDDLPERFLGMYAIAGARGFAVLPNNMTHDFERYVLALCIYYHIAGKPRLIMKEGPIDGDMSAAYFAYDLLSCGVDRFPGETREQYDARIGVPAFVMTQTKARLQ